MTLTIQVYPSDLLPPRELAQAGARGILACVKAHLSARDKTAKHREGFTPSGYWGDAAGAARTGMDGNVGYVEIDKEGVALHYYGGTVRPKTSKALAIPVNPLAGNQRPSEVDPTRRLFNLVVTEKSATLRDKKTGDVWWVLLKNVTLRPDATVLPTEGEMYAAAMDYIQDKLEVTP